jgi:hypothetical protein
VGQSGVPEVGPLHADDGLQRGQPVPGPRATYDDAVAVLEDAAQIPAYRLGQDVAIEKILAALRDGLGNPPATP